MIETELRAAFERAEYLVPSAAALEPSIGAEVRRRRGLRRMLRSGAVALAVLVAVAVPVLGRGWSDRPGPPPAPADVSTAGLNILVAGLDGPFPDGLRRSDSLFIAHVPSDHSAIYLVSVPRDLEVSIPGFGSDRINSAYARGAMPLLEGTLGALAGATFDATVTVDLNGLRQLVDSLGGVFLCVDERGTSVHTGRVFEPGCRRFTGAEAMDYLRQRGFHSGALASDRHVAQFLAAVLTQLRSRDTFANPARIAEIVAIAQANATIDARQLDLAALVALGGALDTVIMLDVPVASATPTGTLPLAPGAEGLFGALRSDTLASWAAANPTRVRVL